MLTYSSKVKPYSINRYYRFKKKRFLSLDEVKEILMDTCKNQPFYTDTVKKMIYIGIKIIYQVVSINLLLSSID